MSLDKNRTSRLIFVLLLLCNAIPAFTSDNVKVGAKAPDFKLPVALGDSTISLSDFVDRKIVIVHFWKSR